MNESSENQPGLMKSGISKFKRSIDIFLAGAGVVAMLFASAAKADTVDFAWTGANGYALSGVFSYADSLNATGTITQANLSGFSMNATLNGSSVGSWDYFLQGVDPGHNFFFSYDNVTDTFLTGGSPTNPPSQGWNTVAGSSINTYIGFQSGSFGQFLVLPGANTLGTGVNPTFPSYIPLSNSTLMVTAVNGIAVATVPEPGEYLLLLCGLGLIGSIARRRKNDSTKIPAIA